MSIASTSSTVNPTTCHPNDGPVALWVVLTILSVLGTGWISAKLLLRYAHPNTAWYYLVSVWISWVLGFVGIFLLPLDICIALATGCDSPQGVFHAWEFVYWTTFIMAWIIDPVLQEFHNDGAFDWQTRLKNAIKANIKFYVILVGIIVGIILALMIFGIIDITTIPLADIIIGVSNAYGMLLIILMLGYGMIAVPRDLWYFSDSHGQLERCYFLASTAHAAAEDADYDLKIIVSAVENAAERAKTASATNPDVKEFMDTVVRHVPLGVQGNDQSLENLMDVDMESVAKLHTKLLAASARFENRAGEWERILDEIEHLTTIINGVAPLRPGEATCWNRTYWSWRLHHADRTFKGISIFCMVLTGIMMWCEFGVPLPHAWHISIWGEIIRATSGGFETFFLSLISLAYMSVCTFVALFQLTWFEAQTLTKARTDASGLLFNAYYACRLQFAIGFNYLLTLKWRTEATEAEQNDRNEPLTGFQLIVKSMQGPSGGIMYWFLNIMPLIIVLFACITFFNIHAYLFKCIGVDVYSRPLEHDSEHQERIVEGKRLIEREERRNRSASGTAIDHPVGGIRSQGYQAPRRSLVLQNGSGLTAPDGKLNASRSSTRSSTSRIHSGNSNSNSSNNSNNKKSKSKNKKSKRKGKEEQTESLLNGDSLANDLEDGSEFGRTDGFVGAGTRAIMGGPSSGSGSSTCSSKKVDDVEEDGAEFGRE